MKEGSINNVINLRYGNIQRMNLVQALIHPFYFLTNGCDLDFKLRSILFLFYFILDGSGFFGFTYFARLFG